MFAVEVLTCALFDTTLLCNLVVCISKIPVCTVRCCVALQLSPDGDYSSRMLFAAEMKRADDSLNFETSLHGAESVFYF